jgi:hypothetical protein
MNRYTVKDYPTDSGPDHIQGWILFWEGFHLNDVLGDQQKCGWQRGWANAYAKGYLAASVDTNLECPYPQFAAAWEAWGDGFNDYARLEAAEFEETHTE